MPVENGSGHSEFDNEYVAANRFMEMYDMDKHIQYIRKVYKKKKDLMLDAISEFFPEGVTCTNPQGGLFTWLTLDERIDTTALMQKRTIPEAKVAYVRVNPSLP
jgi:2-aminoadipate transaminase